MRVVAPATRCGCLPRGGELRAARSEWVLHVDADELLVYDPMRTISAT